MIQYCKNHEKYIQKQLDGAMNLEILLEYHNTKMKWLQHERLIHLLVTMLTAMFFLFLLGMTLISKTQLPILILLAVTLILMAAYLFHYFRLENTVQRWYTLSDDIYFKLKELKEKNENNS